MICHVQCAPGEHEADMSERTLHGFLAAAGETDPDKPLVVSDKGSYTYREVIERSNAMAAALAELDVQPGDRVLAVLTNRPETLLLWFGLSRLGAIFVPVNPASTLPELAGIRQITAARLVVTEMGSSAGVVAQDLSGATTVGVKELAHTPRQAAPSVPVSPQDTAVLIGTSGSTSAPKLVAHSHASCVLAGEGFPYWLGLTSQDRLFTTLPLFHANALVYSTLGAIGAGASLALAERFSARRFWDQVRRFGATQFNIIGSMGEILSRLPPNGDDADNPVRIVYGPWTLPPDRHEAFERRFGVRLIVGYGLTESLYGTIWPIDAPPPYGSIGLPRRHPTLGAITDVRIVDEDGAPTPSGQVGEILMRSPANMQGYYGMPDATRQVLRDGWLRTGDLAHSDENGLLYFAGRKKDIIRRRGENFAPIEVEEVISRHPGICDVALVPVPSDLGDEDAKAFIVRTAGSDVTPEDVVAWCRPALAAFKLPRYVEFVEELPLTPTGRVAKGRLERERTPAEVDLEHLRRLPDTDQTPTDR